MVRAEGGNLNDMPCNALGINFKDKVGVTLGTMIFDYPMQCVRGSLLEGEELYTFFEATFEIA
jgi:hypothetical protein